MMEEGSPIGEAELNSELVGLSDDPSSQKKTKLIIIGGVSLAIIVLVVIIIIVASGSKGSGKNGESEDSRTAIGEINCLYVVQTTSKPTTLLSRDYILDSNKLGIEIDGKRIKASKEYTFEKMENTNVKFLIFEPISMDHMFKEVDDLVNVNMTSDKNCEILSMEGAFENCPDIDKIIIKGFDTSKVTSMRRTFYNTGIYELDVSSLNTKSVIDMSEMFGLTSIFEMDLSKLDVSNVKNMSRMFEFCGNLNELTLFESSTENLEDMSYMLYFCSALNYIDFKNLKTSKVTSMKGLFKTEIFVIFEPSNPLKSSIESISLLFNFTLYKFGYKVTNLCKSFPVN
jgi:surface protein